MTVQWAFKKNNPLQEHRWFVANDGIEALRLLKRKTDPGISPDKRLVGLDFKMPEMGGMEFLQQRRADPNLKATSVIIQTTSNQARDKVEAYTLNVAGYTIKPVAFDKFVDTIAVIDRSDWQLSQLPTLYPNP